MRRVANSLGGSGIRTHDGGFAIRCLSPLGYAATLISHKLSLRFYNRSCWWCQCGLTISEKVVKDDPLDAAGGDLIRLAAVVLLADDDRSIGFGLIASAMRTANKRRVQWDHVEETADAQFGFQKLPGDLQFRTTSFGIED